MSLGLQQQYQVAKDQVISSGASRYITGARLDRSSATWRKFRKRLVTAALVSRDVQNYAVVYRSSGDFTLGR
jgi:hypothetical protein